MAYAVLLQWLHDSSREMRFYPRDAMLARVLAMAMCLSVTSRCSIEVVGRIELVFGMEASFEFRPVLHCVLRKFMYVQK